MAALTQVETVKAPLSAAQKGMIEAAVAALDDRWLTATLADLVDIPSPFGEERAIAEHLARVMGECGLLARVQDIDAQSANAVGRFGAGGDGPRLLVFAPLDSPFTGRAEDEVPWVGDELPPHMIAKAIVRDGTVTGLSADNPKAHITCGLAAVRALAQTGARLGGNVTLAYAAGGAPAHPRPGERRGRVGHGAGCEFMLSQGVRGDFAIITKPGYAVAWEEVGLCWFRVRVRGVQTYVGRRHFLAYRNPIVEAAHVVTGLEAWFEEYARRHTDGLVAPQGAVGAIQGGWTYKPSMIPAACDLYVDLRISPRTSPEEARRELEEALTAIKAKHSGLEAECEMILAIPGAGTDPRNWIIQSCIRGWEAVESKRHQPFLNTSGQTEAVILRRAGIPTARMGLPAAMTPGPNRPKHSMGLVEIEAMRRFARCLIYAIVDTCTRSHRDVGLA